MVTPMPRSTIRHGLAAGAVLAMLAGGPATVQASSPEYVVQAGDTLWGLARAWGCSVEQLRAANPRHDPLRPGDALVVPSCAGLATAPPLPLYTVVAGDTLHGLAARWGVEVDALRERNGLQNSLIRIGQRLVIPGRAVAAEPPQWVRGQSVGRPQRGRLHQGEQLPSDPGYYRRRPARAWGAAHVVRQVRSAIQRVRTRHPNVHRLAIGDLSARHGGPISEHHSHQSGRDVDLGLYYRERPAGYPQAFVSERGAELDVAATWSLIEALYEQSKRAGGPERIFLDYEIQEKLYAYARRRGVPKSTLTKIFQAPHGVWASGRLVQHVRKHDDHIHVRYACPPEDRGCQ